MEPILSLRNIEHRQGGFTLAIDRLDLQSGRIYSLCGPNGAGKSTLMRLLALLEEPQRGELRFSGEPVRGLRSRQRMRRQVTLVHQAPYLFAGSVLENLAFGLRLRGIDGEEQRGRMMEALAAVGLEDYAQRQVRELSGGEAQRVALARALALGPSLLLLDEPTVGLDRKQLEGFEEWLKTLPRAGMTVVLATHDPGQPMRLGSEVIRLQNGRIEKSFHAAGHPYHLETEAKQFPVKVESGGRHVQSAAPTC